MVELNEKTQKVWSLISEVPDPEIPVLTLTDLGIVKKVEMDGDDVNVTITPTYIGCPAMKVFEDDIVKALNDGGFANVKVDIQLTPAWTTDWMTEEGRNKLKEYGISPPVGTSDKTSLQFESKMIQCPQCDSMNTEMISQFGSTPCKSLYKCEDCKETFDYFKCI